MPLQPFVEKDFVDAAALDRDALLLVEVGLQSIECPAAEGQVQAFRVGQRRGDDSGALLGGVGVGPARAVAIIEAGQSLPVEAIDPVVDRLPADVDLRGNGAGALPFCGGQKDLGSLDKTFRCGPGVGELLDSAPLLERQGAKREGFGGWHGGISTRVHPFFVASAASVHLPDEPLSTAHSNKGPEFMTGLITDCADAPIDVTH